MRANITSPIPGIKQIVQGKGGSGKSTALRTFVDSGVEARVIFTEQNGIDRVVDLYPKLTWAYLPPVTWSWDTMINIAKELNTFSNKELQEMKGIQISQSTQFIKLLELMNDFVDFKGEHFGDVHEWGTDKAIVIDNLSGVNKMAMKLHVGAKSMRTLPDFGVAMALLQDFVDKMCTDLYCHFILLTHIEVEAEEMTGAPTWQLSTIGRKLAPVLPTTFNAVVLQKRKGEGFFWDTIPPDADTKAWDLGLESQMRPDFKRVMKIWQEKGGILEP